MSRLLALLVVAVAALPASPQLANLCPPASGEDFRGQDLTDHNFQGRDLTGANFTGVVLNGARFDGATLTGAVFGRARLGPSTKGPVSFLRADLTRACLAETALTRANLQFATVTCTDFSRADLTEAVFASKPVIDPAQQCRTKFNGATLKLGQFPVSLWRYTDFTDANFVNAVPDSFSFAGLDLTDAILAGVKLASFDFRKATLTNADFRRADLRGAKLDGATAFGIRLERARLDFSTAAEARFFGRVGAVDRGADLRGAVAQNVTWNGASLQEANLRNANFAGANLSEADLTGAILAGGDGLDAVQLNGAVLNGATLTSAQLNDVSFQNTRLIGAKILGTVMTETDFSNATMPGVQFDDSTFMGVTFRGSSMENASFRGATFTVSKSTQKGVDLSCTQLGGADVRVKSIDAVTFLSAVMPREPCLPEAGGTFFCGVEPAGRTPYGRTERPALQIEVLCPNGERAKCEGEQWVIPNWTTTFCNREGRPEVVWVPPARNPPDEPVVEIPDPNFRRCLQRQFFGEQKPIPKDFAAKVQEIDCANQQIADATGLQAFTGLLRLNLTSNQLADGGVFSDLENLEVLKVAGNRLTSLELGEPRALTYLDAADNRIKLVRGLVSADLQYLDLSGNELTGSLDVSVQTRLFYLDLSRNGLTDVGLLDGLASLAYLHLAGNDLTTVGSLRGLYDAGTLEHLSLRGNLRFDCGSLKLDGTPLLKASQCGVP
jgi:uncharacterized protein YjbI with pentapeptide repeats